jgi:hypothetical protein
VGGTKELIEKLGRNDPCPCGSGRRFWALLHVERRVRWLGSALLLQVIGCPRVVPSCSCGLRCGAPLGRRCRANTWVNRTPANASAWMHWLDRSEAGLLLGLRPIALRSPRCAQAQGVHPYTPVQRMRCTLSGRRWLRSRRSTRTDVRVSRRCALPLVNSGPPWRAFCGATHRGA